ncbi:Glucose-6-phosphate isomerase [Gossypium arboreum]|uniref:Glucose-6-phosphate isomerase n=1 Tax=Gossypium arboreum TaxID=29729 RepID=A0A0B0MXF6_GOSAR|nr:Glucose-6-phosphate isomerase [Gossypium arboreum]
MLRYQWEDAVRFWNSKKGEDRERVGTTSRQKQKFTHTAKSKSFACVDEDEEKLKDKRVKYEAVTSSDSSINLDNIDNRVITEVLRPEKYGRVKRLVGSDASTVEEIAQLKVEAAAKEAEQNRKYDELQQQFQNMMKMFQ